MKITKCCKEMSLIINEDENNDYWYGIECFNCGCTWKRIYSNFDVASDIIERLNKRFKLKLGG